MQQNLHCNMYERNYWYCEKNIWAAGAMEPPLFKLFIDASITQRIQLLIHKCRIPSHIFHDRISHGIEFTDKKAPWTYHYSTRPQHRISQFSRSNEKARKQDFSIIDSANISQSKCQPKFTSKFSIHLLIGLLTVTLRAKLHDCNGMDSRNDFYEVPAADEFSRNARKVHE